MENRRSPAVPGDPFGDEPAPGTRLSQAKYLYRDVDRRDAVVHSARDDGALALVCRLITINPEARSADFALVGLAPGPSFEPYVNLTPLKEGALRTMRGVDGRYYSVQLRKVRTTSVFVEICSLE